jgi:copper chaperone CopZ
MNTTTPYHVNGMTRDHCVAAVTGELSRLDGVHDVAIALHVGSTSDVTVTNTTELDPARVS